MKTNAKIIFPILLSAFLLVGCGAKDVNPNQSIDDDINNDNDKNDDEGKEDNEGKDDKDPVEGIKITQSFSNVSITSTGIVSFDDDLVTISNLTGGDSISFDVNVANESTILCYYRRVFEPNADNGLFNLLKITSNNLPLLYGKAAYSNRPTAWTGETYTIAISLPEAYGDSAKDKSCTIKISHQELESLNEYSKYDIDGIGYSSFNDAVSYLESDDTLSLNENVNLNVRDEEAGYTVVLPSTVTNVTIDGNGNAIKMGGSYSENALPNSNNKSPAGFTYEKQTSSDLIGAGKKMTFKNVHFYNQKEYLDIKYPERYVSYMFFLAENLEFINCSFDNGIVIYGNAKFTNCLFTVDIPNMYNLFVDHEKDVTAGYTVEANNCTFVAENTAYGCFKVACDAGATIYLKLNNNIFKNDTPKSAVYVNGVTILEANNNQYYGDNPNGIVAKENSCSINSEPMIAGQSYKF